MKLSINNKDQFYSIQVGDILKYIMEFTIKDKDGNETNESVKTLVMLRVNDINDFEKQEENGIYESMIFGTLVIPLKFLDQEIDDGAEYIAELCYDPEIGTCYMDQTDGIYTQTNIVLIR
jgi:hypothetical protein